MIEHLKELNYSSWRRTSRVWQGTLCETFKFSTLQNAFLLRGQSTHCTILQTLKHLEMSSKCFQHGLELCWGTPRESIKHWRSDAIAWGHLLSCLWQVYWIQAFKAFPSTSTSINHLGCCMLLQAASDTEGSGQSTPRFPPCHTRVIPNTETATTAFSPSKNLSTEVIQPG